MALKGSGDGSGEHGDSGREGSGERGEGGGDSSGDGSGEATAKASVE